MNKQPIIPIWENDELAYNHFGKVLNPPTFPSWAHLFHINKIEDYIGKIDIPKIPNRRHVNTCLLLKNGEIRCSKALNPYQMAKNQAFFIPAYQISNHEYMSPDTEGYYFHFHSDIFMQHLPHVNLGQRFPFFQFIGNPVLTVDNETLEIVLSICQRLETENKKRSHINFEIIAAQLFALFTELKPFYEVLQVHTNRAMTIVQAFKDALTQHIYDKQKVADYAELLAVSPNHLNKCVKSVVGKSAQDLLNEMILMETKVLLKQTDLSVNEIAFKIAGQDHSNFTRFFRIHTGMTPKEFKASMKNQVSF